MEQPWLWYPPHPSPSMCPSPTTLGRLICSSPGTPSVPPAMDPSTEPGPSSLLWVGPSPAGTCPVPSLLMAPSQAAQPPQRVPSLSAHTGAGCKSAFNRQGCFEELGLLAATVLTSVHCFHCNLLKAGPIQALPACTREGRNNPPSLQLQRIGAPKLLIGKKNSPTPLLVCRDCLCPKVSPWAVLPGVSQWLQV